MPARVTRRRAMGRLPHCCEARNQIRPPLEPAHRESAAGWRIRAKLCVLPGTWTISSRGADQSVTRTSGFEVGI